MHVSKPASNTMTTAGSTPVSRCQCPASVESAAAITNQGQVVKLTSEGMVGLAGAITTVRRYDRRVSPDGVTETVHFDSALELLEALRPSHPRWRSRPGAWV